MANMPMKEFFSAITVIPIATIFDHYAKEKARMMMMGNVYLYSGVCT